MIVEAMAEWCGEWIQVIMFCLVVDVVVALGSIGSCGGSAWFGWVWYGMVWCVGVQKSCGVFRGRGGWRGGQVSFTRSSDVWHARDVGIDLVGGRAGGLGELRDLGGSAVWALGCGLWASEVFWSGECGPWVGVQAGGRRGATVLRYYGTTVQWKVVVAHKPVLV